MSAGRPSRRRRCRRPPRRRPAGRAPFEHRLDAFRTTAWSSATRIRAGGASSTSADASAGMGEVDPAPVGRASMRSLPPITAPVRACRGSPGPPSRSVRSRARRRDLQRGAPRRDVQRERRSAGSGVPHRVGERLLRDAVDGSSASAHRRQPVAAPSDPRGRVRAEESASASIVEQAEVVQRSSAGPARPGPRLVQSRPVSSWTATTGAQVLRCLVVDPAQLQRMPVSRCPISSWSSCPMRWRSASSPEIVRRGSPAARSPAGRASH